MPVTQPHRRAPLSGAIVTAALPVITLAGLGAAPAQASPQPQGKAPTHRNFLESKVQISAQVAAARQRSQSVTVKQGDSVWKIAQRHGVKVSDVLRINGLDSGALIHPGDRLRLSGSTTTHRSTSAGTKRASSGSSSGGHHTVRQGDTLSGIAHQHGLSLSSLLSSSGLSSSSIIYPGQRIALSGSASSGGSSSHGSTQGSSSRSTSGSKGSRYTIKSGDTLSGIAHAHGVSVDSLASANHLSASSVIYAGQSLTIGGGSSGSARQTSDGDAVPRSFLHYTYSKETHRDANTSHSSLSSRSVPSAAQMESIVRSTATKLGVDPRLALAHARVESGLNARAVSPANAVGVMQVLPSTAEWMGQTLGRNLDPLDPYDNVTAGVAYIRYLQRSADNRDQGIGAYYQGLGGVKNGLKPDTKDYIQRVSSYL